MTDELHQLPGDPNRALVPDDFAWWRRALAEPKMIGKRADLRLYTESPEIGFFRYWSRKADRWIPVAFYRENETGALICEHDGQPLADEKMGGVWHWCCRYPITHEAYERAVAGEGFPDEPEHGIGHNVDPTGELDEHERLNLEFLGERDTVESFLKNPITEQDDANRAAIWSKRLSSIVQRADAAHTLEKRPHLDACKAVDDKWRDLRADARDLMTRLKRAQDDFLTEMEARETKRQAEAQAAADKLKREAEIAARQAGQTDDPRALAEAGAKVAAARAAERDAEKRPVQAGRTGARTSLRTFTSAAVLDWKELALAVIDRPEVREFLQGVADRAARAGFALPGCEIRKDRKTV